MLQNDPVISPQSSYGLMPSQSKSSNSSCFSIRQLDNAVSQSSRLALPYFTPLTAQFAPEGATEGVRSKITATKSWHSVLLALTALAMTRLELGTRNRLGLRFGFIAG